MASTKIKLSEFLIQCATTLCVSFLGCQTGFIIPWPSYNSAMFRSNETVLSMQMTSTHISLLGSLSNLGGFFISPFCGYVFNKFGRKNATLLFALPYVILWAIISFTTNVYLVLIATVIVGIGCAGQNVSIIFISEIAHDSIRGGLTACCNCGYFLGLLVSNTMGSYMTYTQVAYTFLALSVLCVILLLLLEESPVYLVMVGKEKEAAKSISFYQRLDKTSKEVEVEIIKIKKQLESTPTNVEDHETTKELITAKEQQSQTRKISAWTFFKNSKSSQRALITILILVTLVSLLGSMPLQVYTVPIFMEVAPSLDPNQCAVNMSVMFFVSSVICVLAIDRCGRQFLLMAAAATAGTCVLLLGVLMQFQWAPDWSKALLVYIFALSYTAGCATTPSVLVAEVFLPEVSSQCNTVSLTFIYVMNFIVLAVFNPVVEYIGLSSIFCVFGMMCFIVAIYSRFYVPETKGMSVDAIQRLFVKDFGGNKV